MRILVCGGRDFKDKDLLYEVLDEYPSDVHLIHGSCKGADLLAEQWAKTRQINYTGIPAKWNRYGRSAGPKRNSEMLEYSPDLVIAFSGGKGTAMMVKLAEGNGISVREVVRSLI